MKSLLKFEFRKLLRRKTTYIFPGIQFAMLLFYIVIIKIASVLLGEDFMLLMGNMPMSGADYMLIALPTAGITAILLGVFVSMFACEDKSSDVLKNIYARGYSASEVLFSELICLVAYAAAFALATFFTGFVLGAAIFGKAGKFTGKMLLLLFGQLVGTLGNVSLFFMLSKALRKMGAAIALSVGIPIAVNAVFSLLDIVLIEKQVRTLPYTLDGAITTLSSVQSTGKEIAVAFVIGVAYCAACVAISFFINRKRPA